MRMKKIGKFCSCAVFYKLIAVLIIIFLLLGMTMPVYAAEEEADQKVVRVAYVFGENYQEGGEGEPKSGYGYEYLKKVSYYTGWRYEYVYGSFAELLQMLANGEVDLMGNLSYTEERAKYVSYSNAPQGDEIFYVYGYAGQKKIDRNDLTTLNGKKIGVNADSYQEKLFKQWCRENDITCELIEYTDLNQRIADVKSGVLDATVAANARLELNWEPIVRIGQDPYYFGVSKLRPDLLEELNEAMNSIQTANPFYNDELRTKYFNGTSSVIMRMLTDKEQAWLDSNPQVKLGYLTEYLPYCDTDHETGDMSGMVKDLMDNIKSQYGLDYSSKGYDSYPEMLEALNSGEVDVIFPVYGNPGTAELEHLMVTDPATTTTITIFSRDDIAEEQKSIAVERSDPFQEQVALFLYPEAERVVYNSAEECFDAVLQGEVDCTLRETAKIKRIMKPSIKQLNKSTMTDYVNVSFGVREGSTELLAVLNKGIGITGDSFINSSLMIHSQSLAQYNVLDFLQIHVVEALILLSFIFVIVLIGVIAYFRSMTKNREMAAKAQKAADKAKYEAEHDGLTGLFNRKFFQHLQDDLKDSSKPFAFLLLDADGFKYINDTYGHDVGDKVIQKFAHQMKLHFRSEDYLMRVGGDEFAAVLVDVTAADRQTIQQKIQQINENLQDPIDDLPPLSMSVGVAFSENGYNEALFQRADQAMYRAKRKGGACCVIEEGSSH